VDRSPTEVNTRFLLEVSGSEDEEENECVDDNDAEDGGDGAGAVGG